MTARTLQAVLIVIPLIVAVVANDDFATVGEVKMETTRTAGARKIHCGSCALQLSLAARACRWAVKAISPRPTRKKPALSPLDAMLIIFSDNLAAFVGIGGQFQRLSTVKSSNGLLPLSSLLVW
jgi:hypothetical protein